LPKFLNILLQNYVCQQLSAQGPTKDRRSSPCLFSKSGEYASYSREECPPSRCEPAPLDFITDIIRDNHWGYLYNCACTVYLRLVREFYGYLEMVQDEDHRIILQTYVQGHMLQINPQVINDLIDVPVFPFQPVHSQRTWSLLHWSNSGSTFMPIHRVVSTFFPHTDCLQRLCYTIYGSQLVGVSLF